MGNYISCCILGGSVHDAEEGDSVRLVRVTDGEQFEYAGPVFVRDLLYGFEGFAVFPFSTIKHPLPPETELQLGEVYYLRPWRNTSNVEDSLKGVGFSSSDNPFTEGESRDLKATESKKNRRFFRVRFQDAGASPEMDPQATAGIAQVHTQNTLNDPLMELLPQHQNGVVRVKLVISKKELLDIMSTEEKADALVDKIMAPLLADNAANKTNGSSFMKEMDLGSWEPSLESIPEADLARTR